jgi:hypothetical protein
VLSDIMPISAEPFLPCQSANLPRGGPYQNTPNLRGSWVENTAKLAWQNRHANLPCQSAKPKKNISDSAGCWNAGSGACSAQYSFSSTWTADGVQSASLNLYLRASGADTISVPYTISFFNSGWQSLVNSWNFEVQSSISKLGLAGLSLTGSRTPIWKVAGRQHGRVSRLVGCREVFETEWVDMCPRPPDLTVS